jgi:phosphonate ABC transporter permease subunit PhnE
MSEQNNILNKTEKRSALQRLLIVLTIAIGIVIYSYGWTVTEINLDRPQEELRQTNVTRALRELLSPRIFDQERELSTYEASFFMNCEMGDAPEQAAISDTEPIIIVEPACANSNEIITVRVLNATAGADARLRWMPPTLETGEARERPLEVIETEREDIVLGNDGSFAGTIEVPRIRGGDGQIHTVRLLVAVPIGPILFSNMANQVIGRMIQTVFMALVATTVAIPIAVLISFFAARNLMQGVRLSVGSMLMAFIMIVAGFWLGSSYLSELGKFGLSVGKGELIESIGILLAFIIPIAVLAGTYFLLQRLSQIYPSENKRDEQNVSLQVLNTLITTIALIFIIGAIAGLAILIGEQVRTFGDTLYPVEVTDFGTWSQSAVSVGIWSMGNVLFIVGSLIELLIGAIVGIVSGFALSNIAGTIFGNTVRRTTGTPSHIWGGIMGIISGAFLMSMVAALGLWAALLGLLPLLFAGLLGGQVLLQILGRVQKQESQITNLQGIIRQAVFIVGFALVSVYLFDRLGLGRSLVDGTLPPQNIVSFLGIQMTVYMFNAAITGAVLGGLSGFMAGLHGVFPLGNILYTTSRTTMNIVRSIEPLIMGLVFVIWVGIGPFAGVLALTLHSVAALGKLYSEQIENIDPGPIEALQSTGANQLQTIIYAVVPQIVPPYIAFTMYRWDINVRMSTIIGFVGGGGIGLLLQQQINLLRYRDAGVAVLAIAVVVSVLDYASASIRERVT